MDYFICKNYLHTPHTTRNIIRTTNLYFVAWNQHNDKSFVIHLIYPISINPFRNSFSCFQPTRVTFFSLSNKRYRSGITVGSYCYTCLCSNHQESVLYTSTNSYG